jgi:hypothetical protein
MTPSLVDTRQSIRRPPRAKTNHLIRAVLGRIPTRNIVPQPAAIDGLVPTETPPPREFPAHR